MANTMKALNQHLTSARNELKKASDMKLIEDAGDCDFTTIREHIRLAGNHLSVLESMNIEDLAQKSGKKGAGSKADGEPSQARESVA